MEKSYEEMNVQELLSCRADLDRMRNNTHYPAMKPVHSEKIKEIDRVMIRKRAENPVDPAPQKKRKW